MITGIILAGGNGSRLKAKGKNKTTVFFNGKPMIKYALELYDGIVEDIVIVVGAFAQSVKNVVGEMPVYYAHQRRRLGTGHAVQKAVAEIEKQKLFPTLVFVGYGDHMMFYSKSILRRLANSHIDNNAAITLISTVHNEPNSLAWGRIIRNEQGDVLRIVEHKDASNKERQIQELNAGFYCFDYAFLNQYAKKLKKSPVTGEYYLTDLIDFAVHEEKKVQALLVPFSSVGVGINTYDELQKSQELFNHIEHEI